MNENQNVPGKGAAIASMVCGIVSIVFWFFGVTAIASLILGIVVLSWQTTQRKRVIMMGSGQLALFYPSLARCSAR